MPKLATIPRSKAKTAWGLCADVIRAIQAEPKRANMGTFGRSWPPEEGGPPCGTVGCFAGWLCLLRTGHIDSSIDTDWHAQQLLDPKHVMNFSTVGHTGQYVFNSGDGDRCDATISGSAAHARATIARIRTFMQVNRTALKRQKLTRDTHGC